jgi:hypothetical protein
LTAAAAALYPLVGWYAADAHGSIGWRAAAIAVVVCWIAGVAALAIAAAMRGANATSGVFGAMMVRTGVPFFIGMSLESRGGPLADAGVFGLIVAVYLVTLVVETPLMVRITGAAPIGKSVDKPVSKSTAAAPH